MGHESQLVVPVELGRNKACGHAPPGFLTRPPLETWGVPLCSTDPRPFFMQLLCRWSFFGAILYETTTSMRGWWEQGRLEPEGWDKQSESGTAVIETSGKLIVF